MAECVDDLRAFGLLFQMFVYIQKAAPINYWRQVDIEEVLRQTTGWHHCFLLFPQQLTLLAVIMVCTKEPAVPWF